MEDREFSKTIVLRSKAEDLRTRLSEACARIEELEKELASSTNCACKNKKRCQVDDARVLMAGNDYYG